MTPDRRAEIDQIVLGAYIEPVIPKVLKTANEFIRSNTSLKRRLDELGAKDDSAIKRAEESVKTAVSRTTRAYLEEWVDRLRGIDASNNDLAQVLGKWSGDASAGDEQAINALVIAAAFMYQGWRDVITDDRRRGFVAAKACSILLKLDGPRPGRSNVTYGAEAFQTVITPVILSGHTLGKEGLEVFFNATQRDSLLTHPIHDMRGVVGFRDRIHTMTDFFARHLRRY